MPKTTAQSQMKVIINDESLIQPPNESDMDKTPLDIVKFVNNHRRQRNEMLGVPTKWKELDPKDIVVPPTYKYAIIKNYAELPKSFKGRAMKMFSEGCSAAEIQAKFGIAPQSWNKWLAEIPDFADFISLGLTRAQAWWESNARAFVSQPNARFNSGLWYMNVKNRFPENYKDSKESSNTTKVLVGHVLLPPLAEDPRATQKFIGDGAHEDAGV